MNQPARRRRMAFDRGYAAGLAAGRRSYSLTVVKGGESIVFRLPVDAFALLPILELPPDVQILVLDEHEVAAREAPEWSGYVRITGNFYRRPSGGILHALPGHPLFKNS